MTTDNKKNQTNATGTCTVNFPGGARLVTSNVSVASSNGELLLAGNEDLGQGALASFSTRIKENTPNGSHNLPSPYFPEVRYVEITGHTSTVIRGTCTVTLNASARAYNLKFSNLELTPRKEPMLVTAEIDITGSK